jgi:hypothetical protein
VLQKKKRAPLVEKAERGGIAGPPCHVHNNDSISGQGSQGAIQGKKRILPYYFGGRGGMKRQGEAGFIPNPDCGRPEK